MAEIQYIGDIQIDQDIDFQQKSWVYQRVGWVIMAVIVVAALLGVFGGGGLLNGVSLGGDDAPLQVEYRPFNRVLSPTPLDLLVRSSGGADEVRVWLSTEYLEYVEVRSVSPEPERVTTSSDRMIYTFRTDGDAVILFELQPQNIGVLSGQIGLEGGDTFSFQQVIYP